MNKSFNKFLTVLFLTFSFSISIVVAQEGKQEQLQVNDISLSGNETFSNDEILNLFSTRETPNWLSQGLYSLLGEKVGSPPIYFEEVAFDADLERLRHFYQDNGFFDVQVFPHFRKNLTKKIVSVYIDIVENKPTLIDSVSYGGVTDLRKRLKTDLLENTFLPLETRLIKGNVNREISRVISLFQNSGYPLASFVKDSSSVSRYLSTNNVIVRLMFLPGKLMRFGEMSFSVSSPTTDTVDFEVYNKQIDFKKGEAFSQEQKQAAERNLNHLGVFEAARIDVEMPDTGISSYIPLTVVGKLHPKYDIAPEVSFSDENNAFNIGLGGGYTDRNFYGGARDFRSRLIFRLQSIQTWNFNQVFGKGGLRDPSLVGSVDLTFSLIQPYVFTRALTGNASLTFRVEKQPEYIQNIIRSNFGLSNQFATFTQGFLDWSLERLQVEQLSDSLILQKEETRPQFNSIISATLQRDKTNDIFSPSKGFFNSVTLEESGLLPLIIRNLQPDLPFTQFYKATILARWYFETGRNNFSTFAIKFKTGYQDKYGESRSDSIRKIPLNHRFFAGGSGSVRGWRARELGAMSDSRLPFGGNFLLEGNLEERINIFKGFGKFWVIDFSHIWTVLFIDAGNVWSDAVDFRVKDIAAATGFGIRYDTFFGPFRLDIGLKGYDPKASYGHQTIFQKQFFGETFKDAVYHFGIGHAF